MRDRCRVDLGSNNSEALPRASPGSQGLDRNFRACLGPPAMCFLCVVRGYIHHSIIKKSKAEKKSGSRKQDDIARTQTNNKTRKRERGEREREGEREGVMVEEWGVGEVLEGGHNKNSWRFKGLQGLGQLIIPFAVILFRVVSLGEVHSSL